MKQIIKFLFFSFMIYTQCEKITDPLLPIRDPQSFKYSIDTLKITNDQIFMYTIWGSSSKDLWVTGHSSSYKGTMFHYNGFNWNPVKLHQAEGGNLDVVGTFYDFLGFSSEDIWAVGEIGVLGTSQSIHYNGKEWVEVGTRISGQFSSIWGNSPQNIWVTGSDKMYKFDGTDWVEHPVPLPKRRPILFSDIRGLSEDNIFMICQTKYNPDTTFYYLYHFNGQKWTIIDSTFFSSFQPIPKFGIRLSLINGKLFSAGLGLFRWKDGVWHNIMENSALGRVAGISDNYLFAAGYGGIIYHYNGDSWQLIEPIPGFREFITGIWTNGREVFFLSYANWKSYIIHGK